MSGDRSREPDVSAPVLTLRVESGSRQGDVVHFEGTRVTVGRHPDADLEFGPATDREVSAHHAAFARDREGWFLRDLGSRNGTWVDGHRIDRDRRIQGGETVQFGTGGPLCRVEVSSAGSAEDDLPPPRAESSKLSSSADSLTSRIRRKASRRSLHLGFALVALVVVLGLSVLSFLVASRQREATWEEERRTLQARLDSALRASEVAGGAVEARLKGLSDALARSRERIRQLRTELERTRSVSDEEVETLRQRLQAATAALERQQLAASLDFERIRERNWRAVAQIHVELADGSVVSGTAFAVLDDGTLVTARHMLAGPNAEGRPRRIAVQFAGSDQLWPARLLALDPMLDVALLRTENLIGTVPTVARVNSRSDSLVPGAPLAVLGFPLGGARNPRAEETEKPPRPLLSAGVLERVSDGILEIQGYGDRGASGSPIFNARGEVVGVLYGGQREEGAAGTVVGVSADAIDRLLSQLP